MTILAAALDNLLSPMVLFFVLGFLAGLVKSDLEIPEVLGKSLSLYLVIAVGFKGGVELAARGLDAQVALGLAVALGLSFLLPFIAFGFLRTTTRLDQVNAAAVAAHYGSISIVTFVTAVAFLTQRSVPFAGELVAMAALMETPALVSGLLLARQKSAGPLFSPVILRTILLSGSIVLLTGSFLIGFGTGAEGMESVRAFFVDPFKGILCLFLLEMGLVAGRRFGAFRQMGPALIGFGLYMPLVGAGLGIAAAWLIGFDPGSATLLAVLCASASYIVVPAAMRLAVPQADPAYYVTLSLAVTFPFNIALGIPLYYAAALRLLGD